MVNGKSSGFFFALRFLLFLCLLSNIQSLKKQEIYKEIGKKETHQSSIVHCAMAYPLQVFVFCAIFDDLRLPWISIQDDVLG